jgi:hypothetical protein
MTVDHDSASPEQMIRNYLLWVEDPDKLLDQAAIEKAEKAIDEAIDPIGRLRAHAELKQVSEIDAGALKRGFVDHALSWAEAEGIPLAAFRELDVPDDVLREAGFEVPASRRRGRAPASGGGRERAKSVSVDELKSYILGLDEPFLLADVMSGLGGSPATVRKAVDELIKAERVDKLGPMTDWHGAGRAPIQYKAV